MLRSLTEEMRRRHEAGWVGIWAPRPTGTGTEFVRSSECFTEWGMWAERQVIPPKGAARRVVLLGESAARGFLLDAQHSTAAALLAALPPDCAEIIDLARNGLEARHLLLLLRAAARLEPDAVVVYAGNNWLADARPRAPAEWAAAADALRRAGVGGLAAELESQLTSWSRSCVAAIEELAAATGVPVVVVIPESNLGDWSSQLPAPWLPRDGNARWHETMSAAARARAGGDHAAAAELAARAVALDGGTSGAALELLGRCQLGGGAPAAGRASFQRARDAQLWDAAPQNPRAVGAVQRALREAGRRGRLQVVDLPELLAASVPDGIADRRLFFDYCHLNVAGHRVAMAAVARVLAPLLDAAGPVDAGLARWSPSASVVGQAHFAAAIHNAHYGQGPELVRHHLDRALALAPELHEPMLVYLDMQARRAPMWMCEGTGQLSRRDIGALGRYLVSYAAFPMTKPFDALLLGALAAALGAAGHAVDERLLDLRLAEDGVGRRRRVDLLDPRHAPFWYHHDWWERTDPGQVATATRHYFAARAPASRFPLVADGAAVRLRLTARGVAPAAAAYQVVVNGTEAARLPLGPRWRTDELLLAAPLLRRGVNDLELRWPSATPGADAALAAAAAELDRGRYPNLLPVAGHLHRLTAVTAE